MSTNGSYNLTVDGELRYLVQWFEEWSDFQREDFVPYLLAYLAQAKDGTGPVYVNGIISALAQMNPGQDKPMSLFQCRVKLFNEWCGKWPEEFKTKLLERLEQIDDTFGSRIRTEMAGAKPVANGCVDVTITQLQPDGTDKREPADGIAHHEPTVVVATAILVADED